MYMTVLKATFASLQNGKTVLKFDNGDYMHRWLTSIFDSKRAEEHILYRIEDVGNAVNIYIQSDSPFPEDKKNVSDVGVIFVSSYEIPDVHKGGTVLFKILYAPYKDMNVILNNKERDRHRVTIKDERERIQKLTDKLCAAGLENINLREAGLKSISSKRIGGTKRYYVANGREYVGIGTVTNPELFRDTVRNGIGHLKNYGAGLVLFKENP